MTTPSSVSSDDDIIDVRDVIARVEYLRAEFLPILTDETPDPRTAESEASWLELTELENLLDALQDGGGDEQWEGNWYPVTLIRDSYFEDYARELAEDCGMIPDNLSWPCTCIDWEQAARELRMDYSSIEFGGATFWYR